MSDESTVAPVAETAPATETTQPSTEQTQQPTPAEAKQLLKEYKLKVNGKELVEKVDLSDDSRIAKALQMEKAAQEAFQQRAITAKQLEEIQADLNDFFSELVNNPLSVIMNPDLNLSKEQKRALAEAIMQESMEEAAKTPEQLEAEKFKKEYEKLLKEKQDLEEQRRAEEKDRIERAAAIELETQIADAIDKGNLPKSKYISKKLADLAYIAYANGIDIPMDSLIPFVKETYIKDMKEMMGSLPDELIEDLVTKDRIRNIRNKQIQSVKSSQEVKQPLKTQDVGEIKRTTEAPVKLKAKDFFAKLGNN